MDWPLSKDQEDLFAAELGNRAWSWAEDCNPYELNDIQEVMAFLRPAWLS